MLITYVLKVNIQMNIVIHIEGCYMRCNKWTIDTIYLFSCLKLLQVIVKLIYMSMSNER